MRLMRIAHFTDLHLLHLQGARLVDFLSKRWIGALNLLANRGRQYQVEVFEALVRDLSAARIDHAICTGDITNLALEQEFVFARQRFDEIPLGPGGVTVLPGNHDAYVARGLRYFTRHFADYHDSDDRWAWPDGSSWPLVRVRGDVAVIGLTTSHKTPWFFAYGRLGRVQLERLERVLDDRRLADKFRIVAVHHPPVGGRARSVIRGFRGHEELARVIGAAGAELVLHGHEHAEVSEWLPGPDGGRIPVRGIQACTYNGGSLERRARYRVYEIGGPGRAAAQSGAQVPLGGRSRPVLLAREDRVWDPECKVFIGREPVVAAAA